MSTFKNITPSELQLTDQDNLLFKWNPFETRAGLSNYFYQYTEAGGCTAPVLALVGALDDNGEIPAPGTHMDNMMVQPGQTTKYDGENDTASAQRRRRIAFDLDEESNDERRRVKSSYLGFRTLPGIAASDAALTNVDLTAPSVLTPTTGPLLSGGRVATAAEALANPAVLEGAKYTAFGVITVTDQSAATTDTLYFSVQGTDTFNFVRAAGYNAAAPTEPLTGNSISLIVPSITFGAFGNTPTALDSISVDVEYAQGPNTATLLATALSGVANPNGWYFNTESNVLFLVEGGQVYEFDPDAAATI